MDDGAAVRAAAARICHAVDRGQSLDRSIAGADVSERDQALLREMVSGCTRHRRHLDAILDNLMDRPLTAKAGLLRALLRVGLYQLMHMRLPAHAAVHATVQATHDIEAPHARGLVNAVLRRFQREGESSPPADLGISLSHPDWLISRLKSDWRHPAWVTLCEHNNERAPLTLRVALDRSNRDSMQQRLQEGGISCEAHEHVPSALVLEQPVPVSEIPGFDAGLVSVQDAAAQLAAPLLNPTAGERILDACAAPGGKTGHLLELATDLDLLAVDNDPHRLLRVNENLDRLQRNAETRCDELEKLAGATDPFDAILLDAPCSGTGVIRRHPDIKWLRRDSDIQKLAATQLQLLCALWPSLKPGGRLLYAVCSVLSTEGEAVVSAFCDDQGDAESIAIDADWGEKTAHGRRIATGAGNMDGFFYALIRKHPI